MDKQPPRHSLTASFSSSFSALAYKTQNLLTRTIDKLAPPEDDRPDAGKRLVRSFLADALRRVPMPVGRPPGSAQDERNAVILKEVEARMAAGEKYIPAVRQIAEREGLDESALVRSLLRYRKRQRGH